MTATLLRHTTPAPVRNNAGGTTNVIDHWARLQRFLIIGSEGGTYYVDERDHTLDNIACLEQCLKENPRHVVDMAVAVSKDGRAPKNDYAIYALAKAATSDASSYALMHLNDVCRTGTHLFQFVAFIDTMRGWGPALRKAVSRWYLTKTPDQIAYQVLKYQQRHGWSHRDILRKAHPQTNSGHINTVFQFVTKGMPGIKDAFAMPAILSAYTTVQQYPSADIASDMIRRFNLSREMLPTELLTDPAVLRELAQKMPYTALMRNLGNLTRHKALDFETFADVVRRLTDTEYIHKSRVHPLSVLTAYRTYAQGGGFRSSNTWEPHAAVVRALEVAFYAAFKNVESTGKRFMIGLDVSGSMGATINDGILTAAEVAAALTMILVRTEPWTDVYAFANRLQHLPIRNDEKLDSILSRTRMMTLGGTDASLLMQHALAHRIPVDVFVVVTDNETWMHEEQPSDLIKRYRREMNLPDAKLIVLATTASSFSIADPNDRNMLDIAGFDSSVPEIMRMFVEGQV